MRTSAWAASALAYTVLTAILGRDVLSQLGTAIANDAGDPLLTAAILHWNARHVPFTDAWWQFPIYHPTRDALAFSEHLLGLGVISTPLHWVTGNPLAAYNLTLLLTFPLCGMAMYALVYALTRSAAAAFVAGLAYAFAPYRMSALPHIQMLASFWAPVALLGLHRYIDSTGVSRLQSEFRTRAGVPTASIPQDEGCPAAEQGRAGAPGRAASTNATPAGRLRWLALFGVCWALQAASNWYMLVLFSVFVGLWVLWFVIVPRRWGVAAAVAGAAVAAALPLAPIVHRYLTVHALHGFERSVVEVRTFSADLAAVLCATPRLTVWGRVGVFCRAEGELFPGVAAIVLFAAALVLTLRRGAAGTGLKPPTFARRAFGLVLTMLMVACALYALVVFSIVTIGPWQIALLGISATAIDKPLPVVVTAGALALLMPLARNAWRPAVSPVSFYLFAAIVMWLLALGPTMTLLGESSGRPGPFALVQWLPGVSGLRVPARFWLLSVLCLAVVAGYVVAGIVSARRRVPAAVLVVVLSAAVLGDGWMPPIAAQPPPAAGPAAALRGAVVMELPLEPGTDIAAMWRAVTGGWSSVNGYSGYTPNYYTALNFAARAGDPAAFAPFRRNGDLHVLVADESDRRDLVERQPGAVLMTRGNGFAHYKLSRQTEPPPPHWRGKEPLRLADLRSACASETVGLAHDGNEQSRWECLEGSEAHGLVADLGAARQIAAVVYSIGPFGWNVPTALAIEASLDGTAWVTASEGRILGALVEGGIADPSALRATVAFPPRPARYVRVRPVNQPAGFGWFVSELEIHAP